MVGLLGPATSWVVQLEGPEEVGGLLEVGTQGVDLVDEVLNADQTVLAEVLLNESVVGETDALAVDLAVATLVDQVADSLEGWGTARIGRETWFKFSVGT